MLVKILKFSILKSLNKPTFMTNIVKNYFSVLVVISSLNFELDFKSGICSLILIQVILNDHNDKN